MVGKTIHVITADEKKYDLFNKLKEKIKSFPKKVAYNTRHDRITCKLTINQLSTCTDQTQTINPPIQSH